MEELGQWNYAKFNAVYLDILNESTIWNYKFKKIIRL